MRAPVVHAAGPCRGAHEVGLLRHRRRRGGARRRTTAPSWFSGTRIPVRRPGSLRAMCCRSTPHRCIRRERQRGRLPLQPRCRQLARNDSGRQRRDQAQRHDPQPGRCDHGCDREGRPSRKRLPDQCSKHDLAAEQRRECPGHQPLARLRQLRRTTDHCTTDHCTTDDFAARRQWRWEGWGCG